VQPTENIYSEYSERYVFEPEKIIVFEIRADRQHETRRVLKTAFPAGKRGDEARGSFGLKANP